MRCCISDLPHLFFIFFILSLVCGALRSKATLGSERSELPNNSKNLTFSGQFVIIIMY